MYSTTSSSSTPSIARLVEFVRQYRDRHGFSPSDRDMARGLGLERSWCSRVARAAVARGLLVNDPFVARSWRLPAATTTTSSKTPSKRLTR